MTGSLPNIKVMKDKRFLSNCPRLMEMRGMTTEYSVETPDRILGGLEECGGGVTDNWQNFSINCELNNSILSILSTLLLRNTMCLCKIKSLF